MLLKSFSEVEELILGWVSRNNYLNNITERLSREMLFKNSRKLRKWESILSDFTNTLP